MLTINAEIKKNEQRSDKTYNVKLRFTLNRKIKRLGSPAKSGGLSKKFSQSIEEKL